MAIDTTNRWSSESHQARLDGRVVTEEGKANMCSHLQRKLFDEDGIYHHVWLAMQEDSEITAVVRSRQLHIYRNGKKILVLVGKSAPKIIRADKICEFV